MKSKIIRTLFNELKQAAIDSGFVEEVVLVKKEESLADMIEDLNYRTLFLVPDSASVYTEDDQISFIASVIDKSNDDDDSYLFSINDGLTLLKVVSNDMNYKAANHIVIGEIDIGSGTAPEGALMIILTAVLSFRITYLPNIDDAN